MFGRLSRSMSPREGTRRLRIGGVPPEPPFMPDHLRDTSSVRGFCDSIPATNIINVGVASATARHDCNEVEEPR
jgi:hypothetical protein